MTASAFIIRTDLEKPKLLLHMHKKLGIWMQPGGHIELSENPWQAVLHEIEEETGYDTSQLQILQPKLRLGMLSAATLHPQPMVDNTHDFAGDKRHRHNDRAYAFVTGSEPTGRPQAGESQELLWVTAEDIHALSEVEIVRNVQEIGYYALTQIVNNWEPISLSEFDR